MKTSKAATVIQKPTRDDRIWAAGLFEGERKTLEVLLAADGADVARESIDDAASCYVVDGSETDWEDPLVSDQWTEVLAAHRRGNGLCGICGEPVDLTIERGPNQPTIDHIIPTSKGGTDERSNLQVAHGGCNSRKGNR